MFHLDERLGVELPDLNVAFEQLNLREQEEVLVKWELVRARIPEQIMKFEEVIESYLDKVHHEEDWDTIAACFAEISDYASRINELNTWRRIDPSLEPTRHEPVTAAEHRDREK